MVQTEKGQSVCKAAVEKSKVVHSGTYGDTQWTISENGYLEVTGTGNMYPESTEPGEISMPEWCKYATEIESARMKVTGATNLSHLFYGCNKLQSAVLDKLDTSAVTDMSEMFYQCSMLSELNLKGVDTSNVTNMSKMFFGCSNLKRLNLNHFKTSKVTDMSSMFEKCECIEYIDVDNFDTSKVTNMSKMFAVCYQLSECDLSGFDTSKVTDMSSMFDACDNLKRLDVSHFDTTNVTNMYEMFSGCRSLTNLNLRNFNTGKVENMGWMFGYCKCLQSLDVTGFDTANVTNMSRMFLECSSLKKLNLSSFDISKVKEAEYMLDENTALTVIDTPKKSGEREAKYPFYLPEGVWKDKNGKIYKELPYKAKESISLTKEPAKITDIYLDAYKKNMCVGETAVLKVKYVRPYKASREVTWQTSNKNIVTVSKEGVLTAKGKGTANITAVSKSNKNVKDVCKITVKANKKGLISSGTYKKTKWTLNVKGLLEVTGTGDMHSTTEYPGWKVYAKRIKSARIKVKGATYLNHLL